MILMLQQITLILCCSKSPESLTTIWRPPWARENMHQGLHWHQLAAMCQKGSQTVPEELSESNGEYDNLCYNSLYCSLLTTGIRLVSSRTLIQRPTRCTCQYHLLVTISFKVSKIQTHTRFHHICFIHGMLACETTEVWITSWPSNILKIGCNDKLTSTTCQVFSSCNSNLTQALDPKHATPGKARRVWRMASI